MAGVEKSLEHWRISLRRGGVFSAEDMEELEAHVRDLAEELSGLGLSGEEAVLVALRRIGDPSILALEFAKVNPGLAWSRRFYWMALGSLGSLLTWLTVRLVATLTAGLAVAVNGPFALPAVVYGLAAVGTVSGVLGVVEWTSKHPSGFVARGIQRVLGWVEGHPVTSALGFLLAVVALTGLGNLAGGVLLKGVSGVFGGERAFLHMAVVDLAALGIFPLVATAVTRRLAKGSEADRLAPG